MTDGPAPTSTTDALLATLVDEIRGLRQDLATDRGGPLDIVDRLTYGRVELREPRGLDSLAVPPPAMSVADPSKNPADYDG